MGSLMVNNNTGDDILVYVDGIATSSHASYADITPYDLTPGSHRVTLTESPYIHGDSPTCVTARTVAAACRSSAAAFRSFDAGQSPERLPGRMADRLDDNGSPDA